MLAREFRMRSPAEFRLALRGRRAGRSTLVAHLAVPAETSQVDRSTPGVGQTPRVGLIVSRAVGGATTRNRVSRRLRHVVSSRVSDLPAGSLLVLRALPPAAAASSATLTADVDAALRRLLAAPGQRR